MRHDMSLGSRHDRKHFGIPCRRLIRKSSNDKVNLTLWIRKPKRQLDGPIGFDLIAVPIAIVLSYNTDAGTEWVKRSQLVLDKGLLVKSQHYRMDSHTSRSL